MTKDHTISRQSLDRSDSTRAKQTLKTRKLTLTFKHQANNRALRLNLIGPHRSGT